MSTKYRVLRVIEYEGDLAWLTMQLRQSLHGERVIAPVRGPFAHGGGVIRAATLGVVPQLLAEDVELPKEES